MINTKFPGDLHKISRSSPALLNLTSKCWDTYGHQCYQAPRHIVTDRRAMFDTMPHHGRSPAALIWPTTVIRSLGMWTAITAPKLGNNWDIVRSEHLTRHAARWRVGPGASWLGVRWKVVDRGILDGRVGFDSVGTWVRPRATTSDLGESCERWAMRVTARLPAGFSKNPGCFFLELHVGDHHRQYQF